MSYLIAECFRADNHQVRRCCTRAPQWNRTYFCFCYLGLPRKNASRPPKLGLLPPPAPAGDTRGIYIAYLAPAKTSGILSRSRTTPIDRLHSAERCRPRVLPEAQHTLFTARIPTRHHWPPLLLADFTRWFWSWPLPWTSRQWHAPLDPDEPPRKWHRRRVLWFLAVTPDLLDLLDLVTWPYPAADCGTPRRILSASRGSPAVCFALSYGGLQIRSGVGLMLGHCLRRCPSINPTRALLQWIAQIQRFAFCTRCGCWPELLISADG